MNRACALLVSALWVSIPCPASCPVIRDCSSLPFPTLVDCLRFVTFLRQASYTPSISGGLGGAPILDNRSFPSLQVNHHTHTRTPVRIVSPSGQKLMSRQPLMLRRFAYLRVTGR